MFGYHGRCNRHTKSLLLAVKFGSWEGDTVGDTFSLMLVKNWNRMQAYNAPGIQNLLQQSVSNRTGFRDIPPFAGRQQK